MVEEAVFGELPLFERDKDAEELHNASQCYVEHLKVQTKSLVLPKHLQELDDHD